MKNLTNIRNEEHWNGGFRKFSFKILQYINQSSAMRNWEGKKKSPRKGKVLYCTWLWKSQIESFIFVVNRIFNQIENYFGGFQEDLKIWLKTLNLLNERKTRYLQLFQKNFATVLERRYNFPQGKMRISTRQRPRNIL